MTARLLLAPTFLAVLSIHALSEAAQITLSPLSGQVSIDAGSWTVSPQADMIAYKANGLPLLAYPVMEYALAPVPAGAVLTSVTLTFPASSPSRGALGFEGYSGNGILERDDMMHSDSYLGGYDSILEPREYVVTLARPYIQSLLDSDATHLGIFARQWVSDVVTHITSPQLTLTYTPEPSCLALAGAACLAVTARRRTPITNRKRQ